MKMNTKKIIKIVAEALIAALTALVTALNSDVIAGLF